MNRQAAEAYFRGDRVFLISLSETKGGMWLSAGPVFEVAGPDGPAALGDAALKALAASRLGIDIPADVTGKELLQPFGFKNRSALAKGAAFVFVESDGRSATVTPTRAVRGGYEHLPDVLAAPLEPEALGARMREAAAASA